MSKVASPQYSTPTPEPAAQEFLVLLALTGAGEVTGTRLSQALSDASGGRHYFVASTLYQVMRRMEAKGLSTSRLDKSGVRPRRLYCITPEGFAWAEQILGQQQQLLNWNTAKEKA